MKKIFFLGLAAMLMLASCDSSVFDIGSDPAQGSTFKSDENSPISNTLEKDGRFGEFVAEILEMDAERKQELASRSLLLLTRQ